MCSGVFHRGALYTHVRSGKTYKFSAPTAFMAQKKEIIDEVYPGDIVGLPDNGIFKIGDTLTEGEMLHFRGACLRTPQGSRLPQELFLRSAGITMQVHCDCSHCEMHLELV